LIFCFQFLEFIGHTIFLPLREIWHVVGSESLFQEFRTIDGLGGKATVPLRSAADKRLHNPAIGNSCIGDVKTHDRVIQFQGIPVLPITKVSAASRNGWGGSYFALLESRKRMGERI